MVNRMKNIDRIKNMTAEELAKFLPCPYDCDCIDHEFGCIDCVTEWLEEEMKCKDIECKYKELNGGDRISNFYFCKAVGVSVGRGECECLLEEKALAEMEK